MRISLWSKRAWRVASLVACVALAACSRSREPDRRMGLRNAPSAPVAAPVRNKDRAPATTGGTYKIGRPYSVGGRWYTPMDDPSYDRSGVASWYDFHGRRTANGETFDRDALTAAHPTLPLPSLVYVTNFDNGRTVLVRINDRGPFAQGRLIDLSRTTARVLGIEGQGLGHVRVRYAGRAPLDGDDRAERAFLAAQPWASAPAGRMGLGARIE